MAELIVYCPVILEGDFPSKWANTGFLQYIRGLC